VKVLSLVLYLKAKALLGGVSCHRSSEDIWDAVRESEVAGDVFLFADWVLEAGVGIE